MSQKTPTQPRSKTKHIGPYEEQEPFLWKDKRYTGFVAGVGSGKTHIGMARVAKNIEEWNPGEMGAIVAPASRMIKDTIIPLMREYDLIGDGGAWDYESSYATEPGIHAPNGARVLILSADNSRTIERLKGLNLGWWWMDERAEIPERAQQILQQRLRVGEYRNGFITTTPSGYDSVYDFFVDTVNHTTREWGDGTLYEAEDRRAIVGVPTDANPFTPDDYKKSMQDLPDEIRAQEVEGHFVEIGSGVFEKDMLSFVGAEQLDTDRTLQWVLAVDPAVQADSGRAEDSDSDYWAATLGALDKFAGDLYIVDTTRKRGLTLRQGVDWIKRIGGDDADKIYVECNAAQRWLRQALNDAGLNAVPIQSYRDKEERIIDLSVPIERGTIQFVNREMDDKLGYDPRWQDMIQELLAFPESSHDDLIDSLHLLIDNCELGSATTILGANPRSQSED